jgi:hypothetical protein
VESPFNDVVVNAITVSYVTLAGGAYAPTRIIPIGQTLEANGQGTLTFAPIAFDDLTVDNTTVNVVMRFNAETVSGNAVETVGGNGTQLFIEDCIP